MRDSTRSSWSQADDPFNEIASWRGSAIGSRSASSFHEVPMVKKMLALAALVVALGVAAPEAQRTAAPKVTPPKDEFGHAGQGSKKSVAICYRQILQWGRKHEGSKRKEA